MLRYEPPDAPGPAFFGVRLRPEQYDAIHTGDNVNLRYLRRQDVPAAPMSHALLQMHALPTVRLADRRTFTNIEEIFTSRVIFALAAIAFVAVLLFVLRMAGSRLFSWVLGISLAVAFAFLMWNDFPRPTPTPALGIQKASGRIKSLSRIDRMFAGSRSRGLIADQPVDVAAIEFVPAGRTESVTAVDLIDAESVAGLNTNSIVPIRYEESSPRTAHIESATRNFVSRNISGIVVQGALCLAVLIVFLAVSQLIGRAFRSLLGSNVGK